MTKTNTRKLASAAEIETVLNAPFTRKAKEEPSALRALVQEWKAANPEAETESADAVRKAEPSADDKARAGKKRAPKTEREDAIQRALEEGLTEEQAEAYAKDAATGPAPRPAPAPKAPPVELDQAPAAAKAAKAARKPAEPKATPTERKAKPAKTAKPAPSLTAATEKAPKPKKAPLSPEEKKAARKARRAAWLAKMTPEQREARKARRQARKSGAAKLRAALSVMVLDPKIRAFLAKQDPKALAQAEAALA